MAGKAEEGPLGEVARAIGSTLGQAKVQAGQVLEGVKAAAKAGVEAYTRGGRSKKRTASATKSARKKSKPAGSAARETRARRKKSK